MNDAQWKQIPDFPDYWVSDDGRVINLKTKHVLTAKQRPGFNFRVVRLNKDNKQYERSIHALQQKVFN